jgi:pimeloyl-ACP methyl ester carboxylesterase
VFLYGGHTTAAVATEFVIVNPSRVERLVLDGSPVYDAAQRAANVGSYAQPLVLDPEGSHMLWAWKRSFRRPDMPLQEVFDSAVDLLRAGMTWHTGYEAVWHYDMESRLPLLRLPVLALTSDDDPLNAAHQKVMELVEGVREHVFPGRLRQPFEARSQAFVDVVEPFFREAL